MRAALARDCLARVERALDGAGWKWTPKLSYWIDGLVVLIEEHIACPR